MICSICLEWEKRHSLTSHAYSSRLRSFYCRPNQTFTCLNWHHVVLSILNILSNFVKGGTIFSKNVEWRKFSTQITVSQYLIPFEVWFTEYEIIFILLLR